MEINRARENENEQFIESLLSDVFGTNDSVVELWSPETAPLTQENQNPDNEIEPPPQISDQMDQFLVEYSEELTEERTEPSDGEIGLLENYGVYDSGRVHPSSPQLSLNQKISLLTDRKFRKLTDQDAIKLFHWEKLA